jgi:hypothetical protein
MGLKARNIETKVSSRLGISRSQPGGRMMVNDRYHLDEGKVVWGYKDGELTQFDPYTDDNYHLVVSVGEDGSLQLNRSIEGLEGELKIRVMASDFDTTLAVLKELENQLPDDTSMAQINIKMGDGSADWYATHGAFGYSILVTNLSNRLNANVLAYSPSSGPNRGSYASRYVHGVTRVEGLETNGLAYGLVFYDANTSTLILSFFVTISISKAAPSIRFIAHLNFSNSSCSEDLGARHLGETQPYNDKKLQSWDTLTQEQTNKLTTESHTRF